MRVTVLLLALASTGTAVAHVGPSKDDNNRYLKLTPQADRVRLAYTVFFGDVPGSRMRQALDTDGNGAISEAEAQAFGNKLGDEVLGALDVSLDKVQQKLAWEQIVVGMGSPQVRAGAFSVDLVANVCLGAGTTHVVMLRDRFKLLSPGETEFKVEDTHGLKLTTVKIGTSTEHDVKFIGPGGPLADDGATVVFEVTPDAAPGGGCVVPRVEDERKSIPAALIIGAAAVVAFALAMLLRYFKR